MTSATTSNNHKVALITGAAQRIGAAITRELHRRGYAIVLHYCHSETPAKQLAAHLNQQRPHSCHTLCADLTTMADVIQLATEAQTLYGHIDVLINNASSFYPTGIGTANEEDWNTLINSNLKGPFFLCQHLAATLKQRQGCIVNIIDIHGDRPMKNHSIYCIAKAGLAMMTKALAKDLAPEIRVNGVSPGAILWPEQTPNDADKSAILEKIPLKETGNSSDIASTVAFLAADSPYITGQIIAVDGGRSLTM